MIFLLLGCYLLDDGVIDCAADEPCASLDTQETGIEGDTDADTDADTDTDVPGERAVGAVHSANSDGNWQFIVTQPDTQRRLDHSQTGAVSGPVVWLDDYDAGVVMSGSEAWVVDDAGAELSLDAQHPIQDVLWQSPRFLLLTPTAIGSMDGQNGLQWIDRESLGNATRLALADDGAAWILDLGGPTVWSLQVDGPLEPLYTGFDDTDLRSVGLFVGPDGGPWVCSGSGGVWGVAALAAGDKAPWRLAQDTSGVVDCGYDPGSDEVLLFTTDGAILRVGDENRTSTWVQAPGLVRGRVYAPL